MSLEMDTKSYVHSVLDEVQSSALETLCIFKDFCTKNNLTYYLTYGTLLGAVRHKGFIPWDDDIDVFMPRKDYQYLVEQFNNEPHNGRALISKENEPTFYTRFAKIFDSKLPLIEKKQTLRVGVWIDVFPLDLLPSNLLKRFSFLTHLIILNDLIAGIKLPPKKGRALYKEVICLFLRPLRPFLPLFEKKHNKLIKNIQTANDSANYCLTYRMFNWTSIPILPVSLFEPSVTLQFEGVDFKVPREYEKFLQMCYGDYMVLPPKEKQKRHHTYTLCKSDSSKESSQ